MLWSSPKPRPHLYTNHVGVSVSLESPIVTNMVTFFNFLLNASVINLKETVMGIPAKFSCANKQWNEKTGEV